MLRARTDNITVFNLNFVPRSLESVSLALLAFSEMRRCGQTRQGGARVRDFLRRAGFVGSVLFPRVIQNLGEGLRKKLNPFCCVTVVLFFPARIFHDLTRVAEEETQSRDTETRREPRGGLFNKHPLFGKTAEGLIMRG